MGRYSKSKVIPSQTGPAMGTRKRSSGGKLISSDSQRGLEDEGHIQNMDGVESGKGGEHSTKITNKERNESAAKCNFERTCQVCDMKWRTDSQLKQHCCSHFAKELEEEYGCLMDGLECTICQKYFTQKITLVRHIGCKHGKINDILVKKNFDALPCPMVQSSSTYSTPPAMLSQLIQLKYERRSGDLVRPLTIATPEQIIRRILDQEQHPTPRSSTIEEMHQKLVTPSTIAIKEEQEVENVDRIMRKMSGQVDKSLQFLPQVSHSPSPCEGQVPPVPSTSQQFVSVVTDTQAVVHAPTPSLAQGPRSITTIKHHSQSMPLFSSQTLHPVVELDVTPPRQACPSSSPISVDSKQPLDLTISRVTVNDRSKSTPHFSSQSLPPVAELDEACPISPPISVVSKESSLGVPEGEMFLLCKSGLVIPLGITVTKCTSTREESPPLHLLGEGGGGKRVVQFELTEEEVKGFGALGFKECNV